MSISIGTMVLVSGESAFFIVTGLSFIFGKYILKDIYFVIYGIISDFTDKGQFQYLTNLKGPQEGTYLYTTQFLSLR